MRIVWLASYPKSGNTWLRFLLYNYIFGEVTRSEEVNRRIPDIHNIGLGELPDPGKQQLLCKTHFMLSKLHPHFDKTAAFIQVVRHPKDVLLSNLNFFKQGMEINEEAFCTEFINLMGVRRWRETGMGSWVEHTTSWLAGANTLPHLMLRYEDMKADTVAVMERVIQFLNLPHDAARVERAVRASSFDNMKKLEQKERENGSSSKVFGIIQGNLGDQGARFINQGKCGRNLDHISRTLNTAFDNRFKNVLEMLGYG